MANPEDQGTFDFWVTDRISFKVARPKSGDTGDFDAPITDRVAWPEYAEAAAAPGGLSIPVAMHHYTQMGAG